MSKGQHRYLYSKNLAKPQSETLFEEDLKFMELLLSKNKDLVKIKKVKDEERGIETTYITIKKNEKNLIAHIGKNDIIKNIKNLEGNK